MKLGIPKETLAGERRVAMTPEVAQRLVKQGFEVLIETGAGEAAHLVPCCLAPPRRWQHGCSAPSLKSPW